MPHWIGPPTGCSFDIAFVVNEESAGQFSDISVTILAVYCCIGPCGLSSSMCLVEVNNLVMSILPCPHLEQ